MSSLAPVCHFPNSHPISGVPETRPDWSPCRAVPPRHASPICLSTSRTGHQERRRLPRFRLMLPLSRIACCAQFPTPEIRSSPAKVASYHVSRYQVSICATSSLQSSLLSPSKDETTRLADWCCCFRRRKRKGREISMALITTWIETATEEEQGAIYKEMHDELKQ